MAGSAVSASIDRTFWDGMAYHLHGPPPDGPARITASFGAFSRKGQRGRSRSLSLTMDAWIVDGRDDDMLHPMEVVDAALADPEFAEWIGGIRIGNGNSEVIRYEPELDVWEVGVFRYRNHHFHVALVEPRTGAVLDIIERPWREGEEPIP